MKKSVLIVPVLLILSACGGKKEESSFKGLEPDRFTVQTELVQQRDVFQDLLLTGSVKAWEEAVIYPRVDGKLLKNVLKEGDDVKRGQTIALIERDEVGAVYEPVVVPSTIAGLIGRTYLDPGENVTKSTAVALVVNQETVRILVDIPERYVGKIRNGQKAVFTLEAYGDRQFDAVIYKLSPVVDTQARAVSAELRAENKDGAIKSGMFAKVKLVLDESKNVPSVTLASAGEDAKTGESYLFVIDGDKVVKTAFKPGLRSELYQEIAQGPAAGTEVAKIVFGLKDGSKIKVEN
ncbi:MAG: efflux RND transporter periplasmic adaptor subunit [Elusimicrobiota bacterium]|jgi:multidrug efflux pump subunit AcrA (membrane-fusion protein)|nr:efflux RND transporter periplasmic adaptor subunit [Elusimicrobiota bacterium]